MVFDEENKIRQMIKKIIYENYSPRKNIPDSLMREYDHYEDDRGIDIFREILARGL